MNTVKNIGLAIIPLFIALYAVKAVSVGKLNIWKADAKA